MTADKPATGVAAQPCDEVPWHRVAKIRLVVPPAVLIPLIVPTAGIFLLAGARPGNGAFLALMITTASWLVFVAGICLLDWLDWRMAWHRVTEDRFELRSGVVWRRYRSIQRDRVRSVDVTANPFYRIAGLAVVRVGTGERISALEDTELKLDGVTKEHADELRRELLQRAAVRRIEGARLARMERSWLRFAPLTMSVVLAVAATLGGVAAQVLEGVGDRAGTILRTAVELVGSIGLLATAVLAVALLAGSLGSVLLFVEAWWNFRLLREPGGTLRVTRGLLTTRSVSLEESRLRGAEMAEPMLVRWARGARVNAVATGLSAKAEGNVAAARDALLPPAPRAEAYGVAAEVIGDSTLATTRLAGHSRAALRRRLVWALAPVVLVVAALAVLGATFAWMPGWAWLVALIGPPVAIAFAVDAFRSLGHALSPRYIVVRSGTGIRRTVALRRDGIIGWTMTQSWFQRRAGVANLAATTAAGKGAYKVRDAATSAAVAFADEAVPDLLRPFLEPAEDRSRDPSPVVTVTAGRGRAPNPGPVR